MSRRIYAIFNRADAGASLVVESGGQEVTTEAAALNINRTVRGSVGINGYSSFVQFIVYGDATTIANKVSLGVATDLASLATYVGGDAHGIGYRVAEGQIHRGGVSVASVAVGAIGSVVDVLLDYGDGSFTVTFYLDGVFQHTETVIEESPSDPMFGRSIYPAASVGSTLEGDIRVAIEAGLWDFEYPPATTSGWWRARPSAPAVRLASTAFRTSPTDSPPNVLYREALSVQGYQTSRSLHFWPWGDGRRGGGAVAIPFSDPEHEFDRLLSGRYRDEPLTLMHTETTLADAVPLASLIVERCEQVDDMQKRLIGRSRMALLESWPLQRRRFRPDAGGSAANRPWPFTLGAAFSVAPVLFDEEARRYGVDSVGVIGVGNVRDAGVIQESQGSPLGYTLEPGGQVMALTDDPVGILTADIAVTGESYTPPGVVDALGGDAYPFTGTPGGDIDNFDRFQDDVGTPAHVPYFVGSGVVRFPQEYMARSHISHQTAMLDPTFRYRVFVTINSMQAYTAGLNAEVGFTRTDDLFNAFWSMSSVNFYAGNPTGAPRTFSFLYAPPIAHGVNLFYHGNSVVGGTPADIVNVKFEEIPPVDDGTDDEVENAIAALAMPLEDMLRALTITRGPFTEADVNLADAAYIDTVTGYTGTGFHSDEQALAGPAIDEVLVGYTACLYEAIDGTLRVARLIAPEDVPEEDRFGELRPSRMWMDSNLVPRRDDAPGLTRSMGARRNERVLQDGDLRTTNPGVTLRLRKKLSRSHRFIETSATPLAAGYEQAEAADYIGSRLTMPADARAEIQRVTEIYAVDRAFWSVECDYIEGLDLNHVLTVFYPFYGFADGIALMVVGMEEDRINRTMSLTLWGLADQSA
jgi:hypothetical protein